MSTDTLTTDTMLTPAQYAAATGKSLRTVYRYLDAGKLPGARQLPGGEWLIPADTSPSSPPSIAELRTEVDRIGTPGAVAGRRPAAAAAPVTLAAQLDALPAFLALDDAARLLGIPARAIRRNRDTFGAVPFGDRGTLVVPQATVRRLAGIGA